MGWWDDDNAKMGWWDDDNANIGWWDDGFLLEFYKITIHPILASPSSHHPILASNLLRCHDYTHTSLEYYLYYYTGVKRPLPQSSVRRARVTFRGSRTLSEEGGVSKPCMRTRWFTRFLRKYPTPSELPHEYSYHLGNVIQSLRRKLGGKRAFNACVLYTSLEYYWYY